MDAHVPDTRRIYIQAALGFYVEMTLEEVAALSV